ncbi:MAG TPA: argininosuccinate synthase [Bacteroidaceae bacterium]|nr:argininosuccinate synthase [Bacteroidaceae bacterium]
MAEEKVLLALSGGLDTSFCAVYLNKGRGMEVHSALVNTGGFSEDEMSMIEKHAKKLGTASHVTLDITDRYYRECLRFMIFGNVLRNRSYPLSVSSERTFQAMALVEYAQKKGFEKIAHGSTAAGNDQVRFDLVIGVLAPEIEIITPVRKLKISREDEINYLKKHGFKLDWDTMEYSVNRGLWGTSIGGKETLTSNLELPEEAYPVEVSKSGSETLCLGFEKGEPVSINGHMDNPVEIIKKLEALSAPWGIGRDVHVGDTIIGIKGRVGFEAAASRLIIDAHLALEKHILTRWQLHWKEQVGNWYGMFVHEAQFLDPVMRDLEQFLISSQKNVTGEVYIRLRPYCYTVTGINSRFDLMNTEFASYGEMNRLWSAEDVNGFTKILGNQQKIWQMVNGQERE